MSIPRHTRQTAWDAMGRFISTDPDDLETQQPHHFSTSVQFNTPFETSPLDPPRSEIDPETKEDENNKVDEPLPTHYPIPTPIMRPNPPTHVDDLINQLVQAIAMLGQTTTATNLPAAPQITTPTPHSNTTHLWALEAFNGHNPEDLWPFLLQCQLTFNSYPQQYVTDSAKVFFAISYLKKIRTGMVWKWDNCQGMSQLRFHSD